MDTAEGLCVPTLGAPGHVTSSLEHDKRLKVHKFETIFFGNYQY